MSRRYLVDVRCETLIPITIEAESEQEAQDKVREGLGEPGQYSPGETAIVSVRLLDGVKSTDYQESDGEDSVGEPSNIR